MNSAPSSIGRATEAGCRVKTRPPRRSRASRTQTRRPAPESSRAAARPATPAPTTIASKRSVPVRLLVVDLRPRQLAHENDLFVDLALRRFVSEDPAQV